MNHPNLWAPWRMAYLRGLKQKADDAAAGAGGHDDGGIRDEAGSFLSDYWSTPQRDEENLIVWRDAHGIVLLNRYPYANGHLMAALGEPRPTLLDYDPPQRAAFWNLIEIAFELMHRTLRPQGINMGLNEGRAAGAGLPGHLHAHIVPRWGGDTNFMTIIGDVRVIAGALEEMANLYRATAQALRPQS